jgi:uncharacterized protein (TIGR02679 family)
VSLPPRLRSEALRPLWQAVHHRLSSGRTVNRVRLGPLNAEQREALADLLGWSRYPGEHVTVPLDTLDEILAQSAGSDTRAVVTEIVGPLQNRAARRAEANQQRAALWEWLACHEVVKAQPALHDWIDQLRRAGLVGGSVARTRDMLESALLVLRRLPTQGAALPAFAESMLGDPHALDEDTRLSRVVLRALAAIRGTDVPASAEQRRALWESAGVADDELSTVVLAAGLRPAGTDPACAILRTCAETGQAAALTLGQVRAAADRPGAAGGVPVGQKLVRVVENPSVLATALTRFGSACPPLVCTSGWPNGAGILLLRELTRAGSALHYHGDLDGEGIRIGAYVMEKTGAEPWRMSTSDYLAALADGRDGPDPGRVTAAPWDAALAAEMDKHRIAIVEERVTPTLLDDLVG